MNIYCGNLSYSTTESELREAFMAHGAVDSCRIITDKMTGKSKGFGFIEMSDDAAKAAIGALNGTSLGGNTLKVNESLPKTREGSGRH